MNVTKEAVTEKLVKICVLLALVPKDEVTGKNGAVLTNKCEVNFAHSVSNRAGTVQFVRWLMVDPFAVLVTAHGSGQRREGGQRFAAHDRVRQAAWISKIIGGQCHCSRTYRARNICL